MELFSHLEGIVSSNKAIAKGLINLFKLESQLAGHNIIPLIANVVFLLILLGTIWLSLNAIIGYGFFLWLNSYLLAMIGIFLLNVLAGALIVKLAINCLKEMSFAKTRAQLFNSARDSYEKTVIAVNSGRRAENTTGEDKIEPT